MYTFIHQSRVTLLSVFLFCFQFSFAQTTSWKGTTSALWSKAVNWTNGVPDATKDAILGDANFTGTFQPKVDVASTCKSVTIGTTVATTLTLTRALTVINNFTINSNGSVDHPASTVTINNGNWINNGIYNATATGSKVVFAGTNNIIGGTAITTFRRITINANTTITLAKNMIVTGASSLLDISGTIDPGQSPTYSITSTVQNKINPTARIKINAATFAGNYILSGTTTFYGGSIAEYSSTTVNQTISSAYSYSTLMISGTGTKSLAANLPALYGKTASTGCIIVNSGILNLGTFTANRATTVAGGQISVANGATMKISGANNFPLNYASKTFGVSSTTEYDGVDQTISPQTYGGLLISTAGIKTATTAFTAMGDFTLSNGTFTTGGTAVTHSIGGSFVKTGGSFSGTNYTFSMTGMGNQTINLNAAILKLTINKPSGTVNLGTDLNVSSILTFTKGTITTGSHIVILPSSATISGAAQSTGWVNGNLQKTVSTGGLISRTYEIGTSISYLPSTVVFANVNIAGDLTACVAANEHSEIDYSRIDPAKDVNLFWSFNNAGILFTTATLAFNWDAANLDGGVNTANFKAAQFNGTSWALQTVASPLPTSLQVTGLTSLVDFAIGEIITKSTWNGNAFTSDWFTPKNWLGGVPSASVTTSIPNGITGGRSYPVLTGGTGIVSDIDVENAASLTISSGTLKIAGNLTSAGGVNATDGSVEFNGAALQTILSGVFTNNTIKNLVISNDVAMADTDTLTGTLSIAAGKTLSTNDNLNLKSTASGTARIASLPVDGSGNATAFITGAVSIERYIPARKAWRLMGVPIKASTAPDIVGSWQEGAYGGSLAPNPNPNYGVHITGGTLLNGFDQSPTNSPSIKYYDNTSNAFVPLPTTPGTLRPISDFPGYMLYIRGDRSIDLMQGVNAAITSTTLRMRGEILTGKQTVNVNAANFTVLSNPYPSSIDFRNLVRNNVKNSFYIWDPKLGGSNGLGAYVTVSWNSGTSSYDITSAVSPISQYIPSSEAVLVESLDGTNPGTITINESDKTSSGSEFLFGRKSPLAKSLRVNVHNLNTDGTSTLIDGALVTYSDNHSNSVDQEDARKINGSAESIGLARNGKLLAIERRKTITANDTCFINMAQMKKQAYRLEVMAENMERAGMIALIKDSYDAATNNIPLQLNGTTAINFVINADPASYAATRFSIVFVTNPVAVPAPAPSAKVNAEENFVTGNIKAEPTLVVFPNPVVDRTVSFRLLGAPTGSYSVQLFNSAGQLVAIKTINHKDGDSETIGVSGHFTAGKYDLKVEGQGKQFTTGVLKK